MKETLFLLALFFCYSPLNAGQPCTCCTTEYRQFDFWIGQWQVYDTLGQLVGTNNIQQIQGGCVLQEDWKGKAGLNGTSLNFYDITDSSWHQLWLDNRGGKLDLKGHAVDSGMQMRTSAKNGIYHQINWTLQADSTVKQQWNVYSVADSLISTLFVGIYKKTNEEHTNR